MNRQELLQQRAQLVRQRDAELRACKTKWRKRINNIDLALTAQAASGVAPTAPPGQASLTAAFADAIGAKVQQDRKESILEVVRQTLRDNPGFFTARTLVELINRTKPFILTERNLSNPLWRLRKLGEIRIVATGKGRRPHTYLALGQQNV